MLIIDRESAVGLVVCDPCCLRVLFVGAVELVVGADVADSGEAVGVVLPLATPVPPQAAGCIACTKQLAKDVC